MRANLPNRTQLRALLLILNMLMATRISVSRSFQPILRSSRFSLRSRKFLPKSHPCPLWSSSFSICLDRRLHKSTSLSSSSSSFCSSSVTFMAAEAPSPSLALETNPLLRDFVFPPFDVVEAKHVRPGIRVLLQQLESELVELEKTVEPAWPKLVEPLEKIVDRLQVVWGMVNHLKSVKDSSELRENKRRLHGRRLP